MQYKNLPAKTSKDEPNIVKITNRKIDPNDKEGKIFQIPAEQFVYPFVETDEEMSQLAGGADKVREVYNDYLRDSAIAAAKDSIRTATSGNDDDIVAAGIEKGKSFTFIEQARITASEAKEKFSELRAIAGKSELTDAELAAKVREMLGL